MLFLVGKRLKTRISSCCRVLKIATPVAERRAPNNSQPNLVRHITKTNTNTYWAQTAEKMRQEQRKVTLHTDTVRMSFRRVKLNFTDQSHLSVQRLRQRSVALKITFCCLKFFANIPSCSYCTICAKYLKAV